MKNENNRYLYVSGLATGIIMALLSMAVAFKMYETVEEGGSYLPVIGVAILVAVTFGSVVSYLVQKFIK